MNWRKYLSEYYMAILLILLCIILGFTSPTFLSKNNLLNILRQISTLGIIAFGMTLVIISGEIDLSVGSGVAFAGCLMAFLWEKGFPFPISFVIVIAAGCLIGIFIGLMRIKYNVPSFITTLALLTGLRGAALLITNGFPLTPFPEWYNFLGGGYISSIPFPAIIFVIIFFIINFIMNSTTFGRSIYAVGGNAEAARLSGINVMFVKIMVFCITGFLVAISGIIVSSRIMSGTPTVETGLELDVIAAVIIGGTSLQGGAGSILGTLVGVLFIGVVSNGMILLNVPVYGQFVVRGLIILVAVWLNSLQQRKIK